MYKDLRLNLAQCVCMGYMGSWTLSLGERYHTQELMSFHFIFVANFIHDKNPLYGNVCFYTIDMYHETVASLVYSSVANFDIVALKQVVNSHIVHTVVQLTNKRLC